MINLKNHHPLLKIIRNSLINLPTPINISSWWNFGSLLGLCLIIQIVTGLFLAIHYARDVSLAFDRVIYISRDVNFGWLLRIIHANGASFFFICLYIHVGRGIYYDSFIFIETWVVGVLILFIVMGTAFLGYVLPWGQMSFWGATVITNLLSAIPYIGLDLVQWVWGGFSVDNATLTRFFSLHFLLPFIVSALVIIHLLFLHQSGSNNPIGVNSNSDKISFHPFFSIKDLLGVIIIIRVLIILCLINPFLLGDCENFISANPLVTPAHIQPEWYFLFAYAILRSIPNKLGGVIALVVSIAILFILPFTKINNFRGTQFFPVNQILFWSFLNLVILLTWIGAKPVEDPYILVGQILTVSYFFYFIVSPLIFYFWEKSIKLFL